MSNKLTVGVLFCNNADLVRPWFYFLRKSTIMDLTVIAIDQASTDNTNAMLQDTIIKDKDIIIRPDKNLGIAGGRNLILKQVKEMNDGKYVNLLLMDSDCFIIQNDSINRMVDTLVTNSNIGIVEANIQSWWNNKDISNGICFCLIRKTVFEDIGEFDSAFKMFYDDSDFMKRMHDIGWVRYVDERSVGVHIWGATTMHGTEKGEIRKAALLHDKAHYEKKHNVTLPSYE